MANNPYLRREKQPDAVREGNREKVLRLTALLQPCAEPAKSRGKARPVNGSLILKGVDQMQIRTIKDPGRHCKEYVDGETVYAAVSTDVRTLVTDDGEIPINGSKPTKKQKKDHGRRALVINRTTVAAIPAGHPIIRLNRLLAERGYRLLVECQRGRVAPDRLIMVPECDDRIDALSDLIDRYGWPVDADKAIDHLTWRDKADQAVATGRGTELFFPSRSLLSPFIMAHPEWEGYCVIKAADNGPRNLPRMQVFDAYGEYICTVGPRRRKAYFLLRRIPRTAHPKAVIHTVKAKEGVVPGTTLYIYVPFPSRNAG